MAKKSSPPSSKKSSPPSSKKSSQSPKKGVFQSKIAKAAVIGVFIRYVVIPVFFIILFIILGILVLTGLVPTGNENYIKLDNNFDNNQEEHYTKYRCLDDSE
jgi:hypothetical protein